MDNRLDKFVGCLLGGACGDALGYPVEFYSWQRIKRVYGSRGILNYELEIAPDGNEIALVSDDTQMTLYTACGLLNAYAEGQIKKKTESVWQYVARAYKGWYYTQNEEKVENETYAWLDNCKAMYADRAPGMTCLKAIGNYDAMGTMENPINDSKGCGGIMRVAPVGVFAEHEQSGLLAAEIAACTHGHELGYIPAATLSLIINNLINGEDSLEKAIKLAITETIAMFKNAKHINEFAKLMTEAQELAEMEIPDNVAIHELGEGWVAEETLAIAIYCVLKHQDNFADCIVAAVNHNGDSDSTGSVAGNILGAYLGASNIPDSFKEKLELKEIIYELAFDLCYPKTEIDEIWRSKYLDMNYSL